MSVPDSEKYEKYLDVKATEAAAWAKVNNPPQEEYYGPSLPQPPILLQLFSLFFVLPVSGYMASTIFDNLWVIGGFGILMAIICVATNENRSFWPALGRCFLWFSGLTIGALIMTLLFN